jgi:predicted nucleotidyltransferase
MKFLDPETESAVRDFLARIPADIRLEQAILFGSRARGEHRVSRYWDHGSAGPDCDRRLAKSGGISEAGVSKERRA